MKRIKILTLLIVLAMSTSCINMIIKNSVKDTPLGNKMPLHSNPRVGDYAVLKASDGHVQMTLKITSKSGANYVIKSDTGTILPGIGYMNNLTLEIHVDRRSNVKKGFLIDGSERTPLKIAKPGDPEYMSVVRLSRAEASKLDLPRKITVGAGTFPVTATAYKMNKEDGEHRIVHLTNRRVKFTQVAAYTYYKNEDGTFTRQKSLELAEQGRKY